jgi:hypothetical protein
VARSDGHIHSWAVPQAIVIGSENKTEICTTAVPGTRVRKPSFSEHVLGLCLSLHAADCQIARDRHAPTR